MKTLIFCFFSQLVLTKISQCLNYGQPVQFPYALPGTSFVQTTDLKERPDNTTFGIPSISARKTGIPYTIFYPLTFPARRSSKALNYSFSSTDNQVKSRIMNKPELYPDFRLYSQVPVYTEVVDGAADITEEVPDSYYDTETLQNGYSSVKKAAVQASQEKYDTKSSNNQASFPTYYNRSEDNISPEASQTDKNPTKINYIPSLGYGKYGPSVYKSPVQVPDKTVNVQQVYQPPLVAGIQSPISPLPPKPIYNKSKENDSISRRNKQPKSSSIPEPPKKVKYTFPPYSGDYKKQSTTPPAPPIIQQYTTCVCVPFYLCKNGVLISGGKLQERRSRQVRSPNYNRRNKTISAIPYPSNIVNLYPGERASDQNICEDNKVCCQIYFEENIDDADDENNYYPVATPLPERPGYGPQYPRLPNKPQVCGVQRVVGLQSKLKQKQYAADVAEFGEYPWQIAILKKVKGDKNLYLCGGVLIAPQWVATVAHCVKRNTNSPLLIRLGEWDVNNKDEIYPYIEKDVTSVVIHNDFDQESLTNDLALLRMTDAVDVKLPHITPACLPNPGQVYEDPRCWVSGWGKNFFGPQGEYQNMLKEVDVPVVSRAICNAELRSTNLGPNFVLHPGFLCAGGEAGKDACTGDGGSPLVCKSGGQWYVVGLVSWGIGCGRPGVPGVYVNVLYYAEWINNVTSKQSKY